MYYYKYLNLCLLHDAIADVSNLTKYDMKNVIVRYIEGRKDKEIKR